MKYFRIFNTQEEYESYVESSGYITPNVSILRDCTEVWINAEIEHSSDYFSFVARESAIFSFTNPIQYSLDSGETWVSLAANTATPTVANGDTIMWKNTVTGTTPNGIGRFSATGDFDVKGNAMSLIYGDNFDGEDSIEEYPHVLQKLFSGNTHVINAEDMELPAMTLSPSCYDNMFFQCYNLETAPELPAEDLEEYCYRSMFEECTSLTAMPSMGMTSVSEGSCQYMFYSATSLTTVAEMLKPMYLDVACYDSMFEYCTSITQAPELPALTLVSQCYNHMFHDCTHLNFIKAAFVTEPSTDYTNEWVDGVAATGNFFKGIDAKWNVVGVNGIPEGWTVLSFETVYFSMTNKDEYYECNITFTPATVGDKLYYSRDFGQTWSEYTSTITTSYNDNIQFKGTLTANGNNGIGTFSVTGMFNVYGNVMSLIYGDNFLNQTALKADYNFAHLLEDCSWLGDAHELVLPSTTLRAHCYDSMFKNCSSVSQLPALHAMNLAEGCYSYMYYGCENISSVDPDYLPATTLAANCYSHMFEESDLITTPYLPAETLVSGCYDYMFANDADMCFVQSNFTTTPGTAYTNNWLYNVSEHGVFTFNSDAPWAANYDNYRNPSGIPAYKDTADTYTWIAQGSDYKERWVHDRYYCDEDATGHRHEVTKKQISNDGGATWTDAGETEDKVVEFSSMYCDFTSGNTDSDYDSAFIDTQALSGADLTFVNADGAPNIKTDASGYVTSFEYTAASDDNPVMFNGSTTIDTDYHAFRTNGTNFKITMKAYCDGNDQVYREGDDDNMVNLLTVRGESGGSVTYADGFSFRISKKSKMNLVVNGNAQGTSFENPYIVDDGTHMWNFKIYYIDGVLKIYDVKNGTYVPNTSPWNTTGKTCNFLLDNGCSAVLACAVKSDGSYYRYCKCKFFEFKLETLHDMYEWRQAPASDFMCVGENKYYKEYYELSRDGGDNWTRVSGYEPRQGALIEEGSEDCACHYFTIRSLANNNTIKLKNNSNGGTKNFSASTDDGETWTAITLNNSASATVATIQSGETILMKGDNVTLGTSYDKGCYFRGTQNYEVEGNLASLLYSNGQSREVTSGTYNFAQLFSGDTKLISAENLELSSTVLTNGIYNCMFRGCSNLEKGPKVLPALTLVMNCYGSMFEGCIKLEEAPIISANSVANDTGAAMKAMFSMNRTSRITTPAMTKGPTLYLDRITISNTCQLLCAGNGNLNEITIYADSVTSGCLTDWLKNVASSGTIHTKPGITLPSGGSGLPSGWTQDNTLS